MIEKRHIRMLVADLIPYENNPRNHNRESIQYIGMTEEQKKKYRILSVNFSGRMTPVL